MRLAIPALTFRVDEEIDVATTTSYAQRAADSWLSTFLLNGTTAEGASFTVAERARVLDLWLGVAAPERLLACCWEPADVLNATLREVRPLVVMRGLASPDEALTLFARLPAGAYVYSHPGYTATVLDADLIALARDKGVLPEGAKITKIPVGAIPALRAAAGPDLDLWDGSSRRIAASLAEGASGVMSAPLTVLPTPFPAADAVQATVDVWQQRLDAIAETDRSAWLRATASAKLAP
ncbi:MAG: hypothetical protein ACT4QF_05525 [Sporichthyaceae bacterium]